MRILWMSPRFLHPTTRGGQIRTLEMLRCLHRSHEIHYVALATPGETEGVRRSSEYCSQAYPVWHRLPARWSPGFLAQAVANLVSPLPLAVSRYCSAEMARVTADLLAAKRFDRLVCDFLFCAPNVPRLEGSVLFQHNVETTIWERHVEVAPDPLRKLACRIQARRMARYEAAACRAAAHVVAVSASDAERMRSRFGVSRVSEIPTGVDLAFFAPPEAPAPVASLSFVGAMDWMPNIDGALWFVREVLPLIRRRAPACSLVLAGRNAPPEIAVLARQDPGIQVTGTVPDIRPYLWGSAVSIVPLRVGGGTRLKIFEAVAARVPVVSTAIGAEGLPLEPGRHIEIADTPEDFAARCLGLLEDPARRARTAQCAWDLVASQYSWDRVTARFEQILEQAPPPL